MDLSKRLEKIEKGFFKEWVRRNPLLGTALGFHDENDERMPDGSIEALQDDLHFLERTEAEVQKIDPRRLPPLGAVEREFFLHLLRNWIFDRRELRLGESAPEAPQVIGHAIFQLLSRNYSPLVHRMRSIMRRLEKMPKYLEQTRSRLRRPSKVFIEIELETLTRLPGFFNTLKDIGREHLAITPQRDLNRLIDQAQNALQRYEDWLIVDILPDCREDWALDEGLFKRLLVVRGVDLSPGQLTSMAEGEITRVRERQRELARMIKRKVPIEDVRDMIKQQHSENFDGVLRHVRDAVTKTRQFVTRSRFALLPEGEQLYVIDTPSFLRHLFPTGSYWPPARFENKLDGYFFVTPGDCDSDRLKEHNYSALINMAVHEGYPGRHLQTAWATRHPSPLRTLYADSGAVRGWGHYVEERVKEMGFDDTPASRFMQAQASVLAAARVLIDIRLSTGGLSPEQAVESLIDYLGMDRIVAEAEVRRYLLMPGAQAAGLWGREKIKALRKWAREKMRDRFSEAFFHTTFCQAGLMPIPIIKQELEIRIEEELKKPSEKPGEKPEKKKEVEASRPKSNPKEKPKPRPKTRPKVHARPKARPRKPKRRR